MSAPYTNTGISYQGKPLYATSTGIKLTARGKVTPATVFLSSLSKGEARRIRKTLRRTGYAGHAGAKRVSA